MVPTLLAFGESPSITFYNQALAVFGWGCLLMALAPLTGWGSNTATNASGPLTALSVVVFLQAGAALGAVWASGLPLGRALMSGGLLVLAWWVMNSAWRAAQRTEAAEVMEVIALGLAWTGVAAVLLSVIQVFVPQWADGFVVAKPSVVGRAVGNLRQPNHLSTLLVWAACAGIWLARRGRWPGWAGLALLVLSIGGVVWSASRTGMVGMLILSVWAWRDRGMPRVLRGATLVAPVLYAAWWGAMAWWAGSGSDHAFAAAARLHDGSDISSSRFGIWANTASLIREQPWTGVGWGQFNLAWTLSAFPDRPVAFFDHTHNLVLQWAVEMGVPMALLLSALTAWAGGVLWFPWKRFDGQGVLPACAAVVTMAGLHSMLEYPLWYSYFLLPVAFVWGLGLWVRHACTQTVIPARTPGPQGSGSFKDALPGLAVCLLAIWLVVDFQWAANVYAPRPGAGPLPQRIRSAQQRLWFGHEVDYAAVMKKNNGGVVLPPVAFQRALRNLVDDRLMTAYAESLAMHGEVDKARHVVDRLREFHTGATLKWLADTCGESPLKVGSDPDDEQDEDAPSTQARSWPKAGAPVAPVRPFQCEHAQGRYHWWQVLPPG